MRGHEAMKWYPIVAIWSDLSDLVKKLRQLSPVPTFCFPLQSVRLGHKRCVHHRQIQKPDPVVRNHKSVSEDCFVKQSSFLYSGHCFVNSCKVLSSDHPTPSRF